MKKNYVLLSGLILASSIGFSQSIAKSGIKSVEMRAVPTTVDANAGETGLYTKNKYNSKAFGDTLFYEDFDGGVPTGWSTQNNNQNNFIWKWDDVYQQGNFSLNTTAIKSTTASNGFMTLPCDFYNTNSATAMDTYFESGSITNSKGGNFPDAVFVTYQQYLRYCCSSANRLVLQVSTDNFATNTEFDATDALAVNASNSTNAIGGAVNVINISCAAGGASSIKIRFYANGNSHYYWMIDDFAVIEGPANDLALTNPYMQFNYDSYAINPFYGQVPYALFPPLPFSGEIINNGSATQTNVDLNVAVDHLNTPGGGPATGGGNVYAISESASTNGSIVGPLCDSVVGVLTGTPRFVPTVLGSFEVSFSLSSDSVDQIPGNNTATRAFATTDSVFARDDDNYGGGTGPASYVDNATQTPGGQSAGDRFAVLYVVESRTGNSATKNVPTSVTFGLNANVRNIGVEIVPKIWEFHEDSSTLNTAFGNEVATSFSPYTITSSDTNTLLTLGLTSGSALTNGLDSGQYAVGWEVVTLPAAQPAPAQSPSMEVYNDATTAATQAPVSAFVYLAHAPAAGWGSVGVNPVIRLNMGKLDFSTGIEDVNGSNVQFEVSPNPSNGQLKLNITTEEMTSYNLNVRNMLGQLVYTSTLNVNGATTERLDLSGLEKGVYFVSLENENEKLLKKVILK